MRKILKILILILLLFISCSENSEKIEEIVVTKEPLSPNRIAWNNSSLQRLAPLAGGSYNYTSYPRMIELANGQFFCVYEADQKTYSLRSLDKGITWQEPVLIAEAENVSMAVPEVIQLSTGRIIVSYNPRPKQENGVDHFAIELIITDDNGQTWSEPKLIYTAGTDNYTSCAEPYILELSTGELQLYFANENDYLNDPFQNISMYRSFDDGDTWGTKEIVSYREASRDGMPVALELDNGEIIMAIEDPTRETNFKPAIIRTSSNWANAPVGGNSPDREYALNHDTDNKIYQGAPYICKLPSGNIALSYQGTEDRYDNDIKYCAMYVEVGDKTGRNFMHKTTPFDIPTDKSALWNSLTVMDGKVWALSSTRGYSNEGKKEIWAITGHEITECKLPQKEVTIDGQLDNADQTFPFFVGSKGTSNVSVDMAQDGTKLYVSAKLENAKAIIISLDPQNISASKPVTGTYKFTIETDGNLKSEAGFNGEWKSSNITPDDISANENTIEFSISWDKLGGKPEADTRVGVNVGLWGSNYIEFLVHSNNNAPYTWGAVKL